jgi:large subunit ribosomal protein L6
MSRVGKKILKVPAGVDLKVEGLDVRAKGPKGELSLTMNPRVSAKIENGELTVNVVNPENVNDKALWGLTRRLIENLVVGVTKGFERKLEINGIGFKAAAQGQKLKLEVGLSHDVDYEVPKGVTVIVEKNIITVTGIDKQLVGETAAQIRRIKKPEPYKGKGIKYVEETIRRKAGKAAKAGSAA